MTKLIQQLSFSSSNYYDNAANIEPHAADEGNLKKMSDSVPVAEVSKRSAISASDAECFSLCLGAGPLCWYGIGGPDAPAPGPHPPGGAGRGAASPAAPHSPAHDDNCDLLSALLCDASLSDSAETLASRGPLDLARRQEVIEKILERKQRRPVKVDFKIYLTESTASHWEAVLQGETIYLRLPGVLSSGSKDSFVTLLDFAEETLGCTNCIVCVRKSRPDRAVLLRTFMFMGFQLLSPNAEILPRELANPEYVFLHYNMQ